MDINSIINVNGEGNGMQPETLDLDIEARKTQKIKLKKYKKVCWKAGLSISVFFLCRIMCGVLMTFIYMALPEADTTVLYAISTILSCIFVYFIPLLITVMIFNTEHAYFGKFKTLYKRPEKSARVFAALPAVYGLGMSVNMLTLLAFYLISLIGNEAVDVEKSFQTGGLQVPDNIYCALIMTFLSVIIAPLVEEFWLRGILYDAIRPYGNGIAILVTSVIFGFMHGSLQMLFYTTALGMALGYVRYATGSIYASTIMHIIINLISMITMIFMSTDTFKKATSYQDTSSAGEFMIVMYYIYLGAVLLLALIGAISFLKRIPSLKRNGIENNCPDIKPIRKITAFLTCLPVIIMFILAIDVLSEQIIARSLLKLFYR